MDVTRKLVGAVALVHGVRYRAPTGRLCTLCMRSSGSASAPTAVLLYCHADGTPAHSSTQDGFTLARENWHLLKVAA